EDLVPQVSILDSLGVKCAQQDDGGHAVLLFLVRADPPVERSGVAFRVRGSSDALALHYAISPESSRFSVRRSGPEQEITATSGVSPFACAQCGTPRGIRMTSPASMWNISSPSLWSASPSIT